MFLLLGTFFFFAAADRPPVQCGACRPGGAEAIGLGRRYESDCMCPLLDDVRGLLGTFCRGHSPLRATLHVRVNVDNGTF